MSPGTAPRHGFTQSGEAGSDVPVGNARCGSGLPPADFRQSSASAGSRMRQVVRDVAGEACGDGRTARAESSAMSDWPEIRDAVAKLCARFPGEYWRALDRERTYPTRVRAGAHRHGLPLHPRSRGVRRQRPAVVRRRSGARGDSLRRLQRRGLPRPDVHDGHRAPSWQRGAEAALSARNRNRRTAAAGIRSDRADEREQHPGTAHHRGEEGQFTLRRQRAEGVDVAGRALRPDAPARANDSRRRGEEADRGTFGLSRRHARGKGQRPRDPTNPDHDQPLDDRNLLRRSRDPRGQSDR